MPGNAFYELTKTFNVSSPIKTRITLIWEWICMKPQTSETPFIFLWMLLSRAFLSFQKKQVWTLFLPFHFKRKKWSRGKTFRPFSQLHTNTKTQKWERNTRVFCCFLHVPAAACFIHVQGSKNESVDDFWLSPKMLFSFQERLLSFLFSSIWVIL